MHLYLIVCLVVTVSYCRHIKDTIEETPSKLANNSQTEAATNIEVYYARVFDGLNRRYKEIVSPELKFVLTYSDLNISTTAESSVWTTPIKQAPVTGSPRETVDTADALDKFLKWINISRDLPNFDYAILFSGYNLIYAGSASNKGLSYPSSICKPVSLQEPVLGPVAVVEETYDTRVIGIAAQELGRSLGARKDLDGNFCLPNFLYIMTPNFQFPDKTKASNLWKFSSCSIDYFEMFIGSLNHSENCLFSANSETTDYIQDVPAFLSAQSAKVFSIDDQCKYVYGPESFLCRGFQTAVFGSICRGAFCYDPERPFDDCYKILPSDGTLCGNMSLCVEGVCKFIESAPEAPTDCPFGNQPSIPFTDGCERRIITNNRTYDCYQPVLRLVCCETCGDIFNGVGGCEYGDRQPNCDYNSCIGVYDNYTRDVRCCRTCSVRPWSKSSVLTSTITVPTITVDITSSTTFAVSIDSSDTTAPSKTSETSIPTTTPETSEISKATLTTSDISEATLTTSDIPETTVTKSEPDISETTLTTSEQITIEGATFTTESDVTTSTISTTDSSILLPLITTTDGDQLTERTDIYSSSSSHTSQEYTEDITTVKLETTFVTNQDTSRMSSSATGYSSADILTTAITDVSSRSPLTTSLGTTSNVMTSSQITTTKLMSTPIPNTTQNPNCSSFSRNGWYSRLLKFLLSRYRWRQRRYKYRWWQYHNKMYRRLKEFALQCELSSSATEYSSADILTTAITDVSSRSPPTTSLVTTSKVMTSSQYTTTQLMSMTIPNTSQNPNCSSFSDGWYSRWLKFSLSRYRWRQRMEYRWWQYHNKMYRRRWWWNSRLSFDRRPYFKKKVDTSNTTMPTNHRKNLETKPVVVSTSVYVRPMKYARGSILNENQSRKNKFAMTRWRRRNQWNKSRKTWCRG